MVLGKAIIMDNMNYVVIYITFIEQNMNVPSSAYQSPTVNMTAIDDSLKEQGTISGGGVIGHFYDGIDNSNYPGIAQLLQHNILGAADLVKTKPQNTYFTDWQVMFTSEDPNSQLYRRDHKNARMLATSNISMPCWVYLYEYNGSQFNKTAITDFSYLKKELEGGGKNYAIACSWLWSRR